MKTIAFFPPAIEQSSASGSAVDKLLPETPAALSKVAGGRLPTPGWWIDQQGRRHTRHGKLIIVTG